MNNKLYRSLNIFTFMLNKFTKYKFRHKGRSPLSRNQLKHNKKREKNQLINLQTASAAPDAVVAVWPGC